MDPNAEKFAALQFSAEGRQPIEQAVARENFADHFFKRQRNS